MHELSISRHIAASPATVWKVYTERTTEWFAPKPYETPVVDWDLRPGGSASLVMRSPEGQDMPMQGVFLEVVPGERLVSTDAFAPGWVPQGPFMVTIITFAAEGEGTRYTASARHWSEEALKQHEAMGFTTGWGKVADQLAALAEAV